MTYLIVADWDGASKITAESRAPDEATAIAKTEAMKDEGYANAFYVLVPDGSSAHWIVDPVAETVSYDASGEAQEVLENLREQRTSETGEELARRSMLVHGTKMTELRMLRKAAQFALKKANATILDSDEAKADLLDGLGDKADSLYDTIETADQATLDGLDATDDAHWT